MVETTDRPALDLAGLRRLTEPPPDHWYSIGPDGTVSHGAPERVGVPRSDFTALLDEVEALRRENARLTAEGAQTRMQAGRLEHELDDMRHHVIPDLRRLADVAAAVREKARQWDEYQSTIRRSGDEMRRDRRW